MIWFVDPCYRYSLILMGIGFGYFLFLKFLKFRKFEFITEQKMGCINKNGESEDYVTIRYTPDLFFRWIYKKFGKTPEIIFHVTNKQVIYRKTGFALQLSQAITLSSVSSITVVIKRNIVTLIIGITLLTSGYLYSSQFLSLWEILYALFVSFLVFGPIIAGGAIGRPFLIITGILIGLLIFIPARSYLHSIEREIFPVFWGLVYFIWFSISFVFDSIYQFNFVLLNGNNLNIKLPRSSNDKFSSAKIRQCTEIINRLIANADL